MFKYGSILFIFTTLSCESWLDIKPIDRSSGAELFSSREGFIKALNGVYVELNNRNLYGRNMETMVDVMGHYFNVSSSGVYDQVRRFSYTSTDAIAVYEAIWQKVYNLIVNLNVIIDECGESNSALNGIWHGLIKGEALAMRAFLHLDMLRLYGPVYINDPTAVCIPYVVNTDQMVSPLLPANEISQLIIKDLTDAIALLKETDPIIENGVMNSADAGGDNSLRYRQYRMNYYAARAVLARAYMWIGDHQSAYTTATALLRDAHAAGSEVFPFITTSAATDGTVPDRKFSTEAIFSIYDNYITTGIYDYAFSPTLDDTRILRLFYANNAELWSGRISQLFDNIDDYRYKLWFATYPAMEGRTTVHYIRKFQSASGSLTAAQRNVESAFRNMHPLIRITEIYLIAAESCLNINPAALDEAKGYLNKIRAARNVADLPGEEVAQVRNNIEWEFRREFLGDGQMFYFYKRIGKQMIPSGQSATADIEMNTLTYVVPLPASEISERADTNSTNNN